MQYLREEKKIVSISKLSSSNGVCRRPSCHIILLDLGTYQTVVVTRAFCLHSNDHKRIRVRLT